MTMGTRTLAARLSVAGVTGVAAVLGLAMLSGCSGKPDVSAVEPRVTEYWSPCKLVKPAHFRQVNGVDHGDYYQMVFSYDLEMTRDASVADLQNPDFVRANCPGPTGENFTIVATANRKWGVDLKQGETFNIPDAEMRLVKSDNGWVAQR